MENSTNYFHSSWICSAVTLKKIWCRSVNIEVLWVQSRKEKQSLPETFQSKQCCQGLSVQTYLSEQLAYVTASLESQHRWRVVFGRGVWWRDEQTVRVVRNKCSRGINPFKELFLVKNLYFALLVKENEPFDKLKRKRSVDYALLDSIQQTPTTKEKE